MNVALALGAIFAQAATIFLLATYFLRRKIPFFATVSCGINTWGTALAFLVTLAGVLGSLYYSEVLGFVPCGLCWVQRIFLYPQVILLALALWRQEGRLIADYSFALSVAGGAVALYQHFIQMGGSSFLPCRAVAQGADCAQRILFEFGYITFPLVAFSGFLFIAVLMLFLRSSELVSKAA